MLTILLRDSRLSEIDYNAETYFEMLKEGLVDLQHDISAGIVSILAISTSKSDDERGDDMPEFSTYSLRYALEGIADAADYIDRVTDYSGE